MIVEDQSEVLAFLSDPSSYGEGAGPVERLDTHISAVFLVGAQAYKLKRAVKFSYLDYSTRALRAEACAQELNLNRRTAPALYLETRAIRRRADGRLCFGEEGEALDTVVVMRRFAQDDLLDRMAESGRLDAALMRELADAIAEFHRQAEPAPGFGGYRGLAGILDGNSANLRLFAPALFAPEAIADLDRRCRGSLEALKVLVEARRVAGMVRLCHGDLHLRNICLFEGRPLLFDCIEFSPAIASVDVLYDLSFLLMDLLHRRLPAFANAVFNRYFDRQAEVEGAAALPLFLSMHGAIRAHVSAAAREAEKGSARRERLAGDARAYLALAGALLDPKPARLVAVGGVSGTGKSTLAAGLAPGLGAGTGARLLRSDVLRKRQMGVAPETRLAAEAYRPAVSARVYAAMAEEAQRLLRAGVSVVLDAVFDRPQDRQMAAAIASDAGVPFAGLWLEAPAGILEARVAQRRQDASDATPEVLRAQLDRDPGPIDWRRLDVRGDPAAVISEARRLCALD